MVSEIRGLIADARMQRLLITVRESFGPYGLLNLRACLGFRQRKKKRASKLGQEFLGSGSPYGWRYHVASRPPSATRGFVPVAQRWVVERTFAWLNCFRRLAMDYERTTTSHAAWLLVANLTMTLRRATTD